MVLFNRWMCFENIRKKKKKETIDEYQIFTMENQSRSDGDEDITCEINVDGEVSIAEKQLSQKQHKSFIEIDVNNN